MVMLDYHYELCTSGTLSRSQFTKEQYHKNIQEFQ